MADASCTIVCTVVLAADWSQAKGSEFSLSTWESEVSGSR